ncbi:MAG TPA: hypothetical protein VK589_24885 [Chryseolinea sp.]|nr:hypothetical protein [Chryseolinea sp.]
MCQRLLIAVAFLLTGICVVAQDPSQKSKQDNFQSIQVRGLPHSNPMFVINAGDKTLQIPPAMESRHSFSLDMSDIEANWIQSITVLKDQQAIDKYGTLGKYGVVILELKDNAYDKMPAHLAEKFKVR